MLPVVMVPTGALEIVMVMMQMLLPSMLILGMLAIVM